MVAITPGFRVSKSKRHVVKHIIAAGSGIPAEERPPIPTWEELWRERAEEKAKKDARRELRAESERIQAKLDAVARKLKKWGAFVAQSERVLEGVERRAQRKEGGKGAEGQGQGQ